MGDCCPLLFCWDQEHCSPGVCVDPNPQNSRNHLQIKGSELDVRTELRHVGVLHPFDFPMFLYKHGSHGEMGLLPGSPCP